MQGEIFYYVMQDSKSWPSPAISLEAKSQDQMQILRRLLVHDSKQNSRFSIRCFRFFFFLGSVRIEHCELNSEVVTFVQVDVNGPNTAPVYQFLKSNAGGFLGDLIKWNFEKFLVDKNGKVVERYQPTTSPLQIEVYIFFLIISHFINQIYALLAILLYKSSSDSFLGFSEKITNKMK